MASRSFGPERERCEHLVKPNFGFSGEFYDLRQDIDRAFVRAEEELTALENVVGYNLYVDSKSPATGSGTRGSHSLPYITIQAALDRARTLTGVTVETPAVIHIAAGTYEENLIINDVEGIVLLGDAQETTVWPTTGVALTVTNSTLAGLTAYRASGDYTDLVNNGADPQKVVVSNIRFFATSDNAVELLGVKGDSGAEITDFLSEGFICFHSVANGFGASVGLYARVVGYIGLNDCNLIELDVLNVGMFILKDVTVDSTSTMEWDEASELGQPTYGLFYTLCTGGIWEGDLVLNGSVIYGQSGSYSSNTSFSRDVYVNDTASFLIEGTYLKRSLYIGATASVDVISCLIGQNVSVTAGAGSVEFKDVEVLGTVTDATEKVSYSFGKVKSELQAITGRAVYVDFAAPDFGYSVRGSKNLPFQAIQDAVTYVETYMSPTDLDPVTIHIAGGYYNENVVVHKSGVNLKAEQDLHVLIWPDVGSALTITNATPASLTAYRASHDYADLVNQGDAGPQDNIFTGLNLWANMVVGSYGIELLGVMGDHSPTETDFGAYGDAWIALRFVGCGSPSNNYARNVGMVSLSQSQSMALGNFDFHNCSFIGARTVTFGDFYDEWVEDSPYGKPAWGTTYFPHVLSDAEVGADLHVGGSLQLTVQGCQIATGPVVVHPFLIQDTSVVVLHDSAIVNAPMSIEASASLTMSGGHVAGGDITVAPGAGVVTLRSVHIIGAIIDTSNKVIFGPSQLERFAYSQRMVLTYPEVEQNEGVAGNTRFQVGQFDFKLDGLLYRKTSEQDIAVNGGSATGVGEYRSITVAVNSSGTISQTVSAVAASAPVQPPQPPTGECPVAIIQIPESFIPGTTVFQTAWVSNGWRESL